MIDVFIYTAVVMILLPGVIEAKGKRDTEVFNNRINMLFGGIFYGTLLLAVSLFFIINPFLTFIGKAEMIKNIAIFRILLLSAAVMCLSTIWHYAIYINNKDRAIFIASFVSALLNIILNIILIPLYGLRGAAFSTLGAALTIWVLKVYFAQKIESIRINMIIHSPLKNITPIITDWFH